MKNFVLAATFFLAAFMASVAFAATPLEQARQQVVEMVDANPMVTTSCSAVVIEEGVAYTAKHCNGFISPVLVQNDKKLPVMERVDHPTLDLSRLEVPGLKCPCATIAVVPAVIDEWALAVGYPASLLQVATWGQIQGRTILQSWDENGKVIWEMPALVSTTDVFSGNSGGGLFVIRGEKAYLVGIVSMMVPTGNPALSVEVREGIL